MGSKNAPKRFLRNLKNYFMEYCSNSSIHGLNFLGEKRRNICERIWWTFCIVLSLWMCLNLILSTHKKWTTAPVIVTFATSETPIYLIPFPAITICPLVQIDKEKFDVSRDDYSEEERVNLLYASLVCPNIASSFPVLSHIATVDDVALEFLLNVSHDLGKMIVMCQLSQKSCAYEELHFTPILTHGGVCYSFNFIDRDDLFSENTKYYERLNVQRQKATSWHMGYGYEKNATLITYPRRALLTGTSGGLDLVLLGSKRERNSPCGDFLSGFKVVIHHPGEFPRDEESHFLLPLNQLVSVGVKPNLITTSTALKNYQPQHRRCFMPNEKNLSFFKVYDQRNCLIECLSNYSYKKCDCVGFYMPRNKSMPICGPSYTECLREAQYEFVVKDSEFELKRRSSILRMSSDVSSASPPRVYKKVPKPDCNCLPSCYSLTYDIETSQMDWDWPNTDRYNNQIDTTTELSRLKIFFKDLQFMSCERSELYGESEFWANCGGLLSLFTGFSLISLIEILYYLTLRLYYNVRKYGLKDWGAQNGPNDIISTSTHNT